MQTDSHEGGLLGSICASSRFSNDTKLRWCCRRPQQCKAAQFDCGHSLCARLRAAPSRALYSFGHLLDQCTYKWGICAALSPIELECLQFELRERNVLDGRDPQVRPAKGQPNHMCVTAMLAPLPSCSAACPARSDFRVQPGSARASMIRACSRTVRGPRRSARTARSAS